MGEGADEISGREKSQVGRASTDGSKSVGRPDRWRPACNALSKERDLVGGWPWDTRAPWEECPREDDTSQGPDMELPPWP